MLDCGEFDLEFGFSAHRMLVKDIEYQINPIPNLDLVRFHHSHDMKHLTGFELVSDDEKIYSLCEHLLVDLIQLPTT